MIDVAPDAAELLFGGDDPPATWPVRRASEEPGLGTRVLLLGAMPTVLPEDAHRFMAIDMAVDAAPSSLAELEAELRDEASASSVDILVARADARGVRGGPRDPRRSPEALLLRAAQLSHRVVLVTCPDEACVLRAVRAAHHAAEGGAVGLPARLARMRDQHAPSATLYRLQSGDRVRLATSRAPR